MTRPYSPFNYQTLYIFPMFWLVAPPVEGESEVEEELRVGKQDTKKLLKRVKEMNGK